MKKSWVMILCAALVAGALVFAGCSLRTASDEPEVRSNGEAIQWKRSSESEWHDLVSLADLKGAAGENGQNGLDGKNGADGKDGTNGLNGQDGKDGLDGKAIEVRKSEGAVQWRYEGGQWQDLVALSDITGPAGMNGEKGETGRSGADGKTPEFRVENGTLQWRYAGEAVWLNLYDLSALKGADGIDGKDGKDGVDGTNGTGIAKTEINANGELLITYTNGVTVNLGKVVGADGKDGRDGIDGIDGIDGKDGADGEDGTDGKDGACPGYFYATGTTSENVLNWPLIMSEKVNSGGLISYNAADRTITLKKGHTYNVCFTGSLRFNSNDSKNLSMGVWLEDGYQPDIAKSATFTREYNEGNKYVSLRIPMTYIRFYVADSQDITLQYTLLKEHSGTYVDYLGYHLTITALN